MMSDNGTTFRIALSMTPQVNAEVVRRMNETGISPEEFFSLETPALSERLGLNSTVRFEKMHRDEALFAARKETEAIANHRIKALYLGDDDYPVRLSQIPDAPVVLYVLGDADLDSRHILNVVGTRKPTPYGVGFAQKLVKDLAVYFDDLTVVSGLAYGIDSAAHTAALEADAVTVAVVAHGLNMIYPAAHRDLARRIIHNGGAVVSEYPFGSPPYRQRFLERNRIVAGLSDVTVVVESDIRGGAMSTANTAFSYSRDVMALPGRISDKLSSGCNLLLRKEKAHLITAAPDLIELTGWQPLDLKIDTTQRNLFPELEGDSKKVLDAISRYHEPLQIDRISHLTGLPIPTLMGILADLEFDGIVTRHPGNRYSQ